MTTPLLKLPNFETQFVTLHHIDIEKDKVSSSDNKEIREDFSKYIREIIEKTIEGKNTREFNVVSLTKEVLSQVLLLKNEDYDNTSITDTIANRLLETEKEAQESYKQLKGTKRGSLIQSYMSYYDTKVYLLAKVEHSAFIDELDYEKHIGLPYEKTVLKTCVIRFDEQDNIEKILLSDTSAKIAKYWWHDFLELKKERSDEENTDKAYRAMENLLVTYVRKKDASRDYQIMRNQLIGYFKTMEGFNVQGVIEGVFNYEPISEAVDMKSLREKVYKLPETKKFDAVFDIEPSAVNARIKDVISITTSIDLTIKDYLHKMDDIIDTEVVGNKRFIKIKVENKETFDRFNRKLKKQ
jgi:hypothetical protein